jgi:hypothetical protein
MSGTNEEFRWAFSGHRLRPSRALGDGGRAAGSRNLHSEEPDAFAKRSRPARRSDGPHSLSPTQGKPTKRPSPAAVPRMAHEIAKLLLEHAGTFLERSEAIKTAMDMGMPLAEIERFLDWLDANRGPVRQDQNDSEPPPKK